MIRLSDMTLARELVRQAVVVEWTTDYELHLSPDDATPEFLAIDPTLDVNDLIEGMRNTFASRDFAYWGGAYDAILRVMTDDQLNDWRLLCMAYGRVGCRLNDRISALGEEAVHALETIVETTGCALEGFKDLVGYESSGTADRADLWRTRFSLRLGPDAGVEEEAGAYDFARFTPGERRGLDRWFASHMAPLGMKYTTAALALDMLDRYGVRTRRALRAACRKASKALDFAVGFNDL